MPTIEAFATWGSYYLGYSDREVHGSVGLRIESHPAVLKYRNGVLTAKTPTGDMPITKRFSAFIVV
jgi:hypothetical protein